MLARAFTKKGKLKLCEKKGDSSKKQKHSTKRFYPEILLFISGLLRKREKEEESVPPIELLREAIKW